MENDELLGPATRTVDIPTHLAAWQLPPGWKWGESGLLVDHRHIQEIRDSFERSLALVTAPAPAYEPWLFSEAKVFAHCNHPAIPTTFHHWSGHAGNGRGPGYLRRWITGETVGTRIRRLGTDTVPYMLGVLRAAGSAIAYLHDSSHLHGAISPESIYVTPTSRVWLLGWPWAVPRADIPTSLAPDPRWTPSPPEWTATQWTPSALSDQWQLAATCFGILTGELPPRREIPPIRWLRPDCPSNVAELLERALSVNPVDRFHSVASLLRAIEQISSSGSSAITGLGVASGEFKPMNEEQRLRWATGDEYEVLSLLGSGTFGTVWRVRDLTLQREVALKILHPSLAKSENALSRFRKEAQLAAQLQHPAIVPIYSWEQRGGLHWFVMELEEEGSIGDLVRRSGPRPIDEVAPHLATLLEGLAAAHQNGIIHRDLKPENVLLSRYGQWRIADFGIASALGGDGAGTSGTPAFAPPEQLLGEPQGVPADLFAVAAIAYFALVGVAPFVGADARSILAQQLASKADLSKVPAELRGWFTKGLSVDPDARFADALVMRDAWNDAVRPSMRESEDQSLAARIKRAAAQLFR